MSLVDKLARKKRYQKKYIRACKDRWAIDNHHLIKQLTSSTREASGSLEEPQFYVPSATYRQHLYSVSASENYMNFRKYIKSLIIDGIIAPLALAVILIIFAVFYIKWQLSIFPISLYLFILYKQIDLFPQSSDFKWAKHFKFNYYEKSRGMYAVAVNSRGLTIGKVRDGGVNTEFFHKNSISYLVADDGSDEIFIRVIGRYLDISLSPQRDYGIKASVFKKALEQRMVY